jgi:hypothetical protein
VGRRRGEEESRGAIVIQNGNELIARASIPALVAAWNKSVSDLTEGFRLVNEAKERLQLVFGTQHYGFRIGDRHDRVDFDNPTAVVAGLKRDAWRCLADRLGLKQMMSVAKAEQLDKQLESGEGLPEITDADLTAAIMGLIESVPDMMAEAVVEVFEILRPQRSRLVTNHKFEVGERVILAYMVESQWNGKGFRPGSYGRDDKLRAIDNVFHRLAGKGLVATHRGPLVDAIHASPDGKGETEFFEFKCCKNQNLHLRFKRLDLVGELNRIAADPRAIGNGERK